MLSVVDAVQGTLPRLLRDPLLYAPPQLLGYGNFDLYDPESSDDD